MTGQHASPDTTSPSLREDVRSVTDAWEVAGFSRTMPGERACGDAVSVFPSERGVTVLVVDGLGHGARAHEASAAAVAYVTQRLEAHPETGLETLMQGCHKAMAGTRGAAVGICRVEPASRTLRFCGVGNIAMTSHPSRRGMGVSLAGVVGYRMRKVKEFVCELEPGDLVALYSDGVSSSFSLKRIASHSLDQLLDTVLDEWAKDHDDATFVALRLAPGKL
jgi:negative regulator of sigma-B (phosphoserine phosphatase)